MILNSMGGLQAPSQRRQAQEVIVVNQRGPAKVDGRSLTSTVTVSPGQALASSVDREPSDLGQTAL